MKNLKNKIFGKLTAKYSIKHKGRLGWYCECSCGGKTIALTTNLLSGNSKSCGCNIGKSLRTHGYSKHPCYQSWRCMCQRCLNTNSSDYPNYGGRGITICGEWDSIETFISDMGLPPSKHHTIERINGNKEYSPSNCKWATRKEQAQNRRNTPILEGLKLKQWCIKYKIPYTIAYNRFWKGWSANRIQETPIIHNYKQGQLCDILGCNNPVKSRGLCNRHYLKWWYANKKKEG